MDFKECQDQSFDIITRIENFMSEEEEENDHKSEIKKIFLGWIQKKWM